MSEHGSMTQSPPPVHEQTPGGVPAGMHEAENDRVLDNPPRDVAPASQAEATSPSVDEFPLPTPAPLLPLPDSMPAHEPLLPEHAEEKSSIAVPPEPPSEPAPPAVASAVTTPPAAAQSPDTVQLMDERLRRLEAMLVTLSERKHVEAPVATLVVEKPQESIREKAGRLADAGRAILPMAASLLRAPDPTSPRALAGAALAGKSHWLLVEVYLELRTIVSMFFDRGRYKVSLKGWLVPVICLLVILLDGIFIESIPLLGPAIARLPFIARPLYAIIDMLAAIVMYKALLREAARYTATIEALQSPAAIQQ